MLRLSFVCLESWLTILACGEAAVDTYPGLHGTLTEDANGSLEEVILCTVLQETVLQSIPANLHVGEEDKSCLRPSFQQYYPPVWVHRSFTYTQVKSQLFH